MRRLQLAFPVALLGWAVNAWAGGPSAPMASPEAQNVAPRDVSPITDSPPPGLRGDLGAVIEPTITLSAEAPYVAGRASLSVGTDADEGGWSANPTGPNGASYFVLANTSISPPATGTIESTLSPDLLAKVQSAMAGNDPNVLESLANSIDGKTYPLTVAALRARAAWLRTQPNARYMSVTAAWKEVLIDFASPAKAKSSVVTCHLVHTGGKSDLDVSGATTKRIPNRTGQWIEAGQDGARPGALAIVISPTSIDQTWTMDRCLVTGYTLPSSSAPLSAAARFKRGASGTPTSPTMAAPVAAGGAQPSSLAAASPAGNATVESAVSVSPQHPAIANRAFMSAAWRGLRLPLSSANADATHNAFTLRGGGGSASFTLSVDVYRLPQRTEIVACDIANVGDSPLSMGGQSIPANGSKSVEVTLAPVGAPVWQTARFAGASVNGLAVSECHIRTMASGPASSVSRRVIR